ncbi:hypothetical protein A2W32_05610 [candidate division WWE3 bacterium RBG_16_37_10]|uniref:TVP38/TMEM64 family membrane protein n=1 Tax=candidate division WWE3 bacterium RBG_16_37_10 TaxID=1802610 RepID=A0A1F4V1Z9_UNCKA|nr:MAG: hypothetical protein A2W32_05610 [candidate division WWE3 bacterium RBG_16_37_10]
MEKKPDLVGKLLVIIFGIILVGILVNLSVPYLNSARFKAFIEGMGPLGPIFIVSFTAFSQIFAPLPGSPASLISIAVYGYTTTVIFVYFGGLLSASISFYLSRRFGRKLVIKFVGQNTMNEIDDFARAEGTEVLIISRLIGFPLFDYISYAAGLTNIPFNKYFAITAVCSIIPTLILAVLFKGLDFSSRTGFTIWFVSLNMVGLVFGLLIKKYINKRNNEKKIS